jgi:hypothetical protein
MTKTTMFRIIIAACFITVSLFSVSGVWATTENECLIGGGHVASGSGCSFCVGGKYDLTEITAVDKAGKKETTLSVSEQKTNAASSGQPGKKTVAKSPAGN